MVLIRLDNGCSSHDLCNVRNKRSRASLAHQSVSFAGTRNGSRNREGASLPGLDLVSVRQAADNDHVVSRRTRGAFFGADQQKCRQSDQTRVYRGVGWALPPSSQVNCLIRGLEFGRHPHQVSERIRLHFLHDLPTVCLYRDLADAQLATNLFIQQPRDN
jgi:hypothetical protein